MGVLCFEIEDHGDAGEVEAGVEQVADAAEAVEVVGAVAAGAAVGAGWLEQAAGFVEAQVLYAGADQFGGDRDAVDARSLSGWVTVGPLVEIFWLFLLPPCVTVI